MWGIRDQWLEYDLNGGNTLPSPCNPGAGWRGSLGWSSLMLDSEMSPLPRGLKPEKESV